MRTVFLKSGAPAALLLAAIGIWVVSQPVATQGGGGGRRTVMVNGHEAAAGEVLVRFNRTLSTGERAQVEGQVDADQSEAISSSTRRMRSRSYDTETLVAYLRSRPDVALAEPNYVQYALTTTPNDPYLSLLWGLLNTGQTVNGDLGTANNTGGTASAYGCRANCTFEQCGDAILDPKEQCDFALSGTLASKECRMIFG